MITLSIELAKVLMLLGGVMTLAAILTWMERKQSAIMQDRIGANRASAFVHLMPIVRDTSDPRRAQVGDRGAERFHSEGRHASTYPRFLLYVHRR